MSTGDTLMAASARMTVAQAIDTGAFRLQGIVDNPRLEARLLLAHALGVTRNELIRDPACPIDPAYFAALIERRLKHEPLALIIGRREFWSLDFQVSPAALIPRPDSETLIEAGLAYFAGRRPPQRIIDLGTGTGCLLLALLTEFPAAFGVGLDLAADAAALAKANATRLGLSQRSAFVVGNWTDAVAGRFDLIVANPPYVRSADIALLMPDVACHEPHRALDGGVDGHASYQAIIPALKSCLAPGGAAVLELGAGQAKYLEELARAAGLRVAFHLDLAGIHRAAVLTAPSD